MATEHLILARPTPVSPLGAWLQPVLRWIERDRERRQTEKALNDMPDYLRKDIGLDGGARLVQPRFVGRTFIDKGCPDSTLSGWRW